MLRLCPKFAEMEKKKRLIQLKSGINLSDLINSNEFQLNIDHTGAQTSDNTDFSDIWPSDDEDSDSEDVLANVSKSIEGMMLSSPEYISFQDLSTKMVDCEPSGGVKILVIEEGTGPLIPVDAVVTLHYAAYWEKTEVPFDCTLANNHGAPQVVPLGKGKCIPGLEMALTTVRGPKARMLALLQPHMAWGPRGAPPRIRAEPALFVVALYQVEQADEVEKFNKLSNEEQVKFIATQRAVQSICEQSKKLYAKNQYQRCIDNYQRAMRLLILCRPEEEEVQLVKKEKVKLYINLCLCFYKLNKPKHIIGMCENIDRISDIEKHCKALYYFGRANHMMGRREEAFVYYRKALKLEPHNKELGKLLAELEVIEKKSAAEEKEMWQRAMQAKPKEKEVVYDVDEDFQDGVHEMCKDLTGRSGTASMDLPVGLTNDEVMFLKSTVEKYKNLIVEQDKNGQKMRITKRM